MRLKIVLIALALIIGISMFITGKNVLHADESEVFIDLSYKGVGSVTFDQPQNDDGSYPINVNMTAVPADGWQFLQFSVNNGNGTSKYTNNPIECSFSGSWVVWFVPVASWVDVADNQVNFGTNGNVSDSDITNWNAETDQYDGNYNIWFPDADNTTQLTAIPNQGYQFVNWFDWTNNENLGTQNPINLISPGDYGDTGHYSTIEPVFAPIGAAGGSGSFTLDFTPILPYILLTLFILVWVFTRNNVANIALVIPLWCCLIYIILNTASTWMQIACETAGVAISIIGMARALNRA